MINVDESLMDFIQDKNTKVIELPLEEYEALLAGDLVAEYNTVYVCVEARDFVLTEATAVLLFDTEKYTVNRLLDRMRNNPFALAAEQLSCNIATQGSTGRKLVVKAVNREQLISLAFKIATVSASKVRQFVNALTEKYFFGNVNQLTGNSLFVDYPSMKDKAPEFKNHEVHKLDNHVNEYKKSLYPNKGKPWTSKEDFDIVAMLKENVSIVEIANVLDRTVKAVC